MNWKRSVAPPALVLALAVATQSAAAADIVAPAAVATPQTVYTLAAATDTVIASDTTRRYLCVMNIGSGLATLGFAQAAVAGAGWALEPASVAGHQGGAMCWDSAIVTAAVVHAISASGTTLAVLEGH